MRKIIIISTIIVLVTFNMLLLWQKLQRDYNEKNFKDKIEYLERNSGKKTETIKQLSEAEMEQFFSNGYTINLSYLDLFKRNGFKQKVYFRLFKNGCHDCIDSILTNLNLYSKLVGKNNIVILGDWNSSLDLKRFLKAKQINNIPIEIIPAGEIHLPVEKAHKHYFFVLKKDENSFRDFFIPNEYMPERTKDYLKILRFKYFTRN
jgi:hypothetical protein